MQFTPIDLSTWPRREHFHYYRNQLPCGYSVTVQLDVTRFRAMLERKGLKFYPSFIWCVSHTILSHPAFRMGVDSEGQPGTYDRMHPNYTVFHEDDHTFSDLWTEHNESFPVFYQAFLSDVATYGTRHGMKARAGQPANFYCISCVPWLSFTGYASTVPGGQPNLFPVITYGKAAEHQGTWTMPFAVNISHAAADGWHTAQFLNDLQALLDSEARGENPNGKITLVVASKPGVYALERAAKAGVESCVVRRRDYDNSEDFDAALLGTLKAHNIDLVVLAGFLSVLGPSVIAAYPRRILNVHPALIPSFCGPGMYGLRPHEVALARGCKVTGATVHFVNEECDGGPILLQKAVDILPGDTPEVLQKRVMEQAEWKLLPKAVAMVCSGEIE